MALVLGTNAGFVTTAPTADPAESIAAMDDRAITTKHTTPVGVSVVTEIGWYASTDAEEANFEVGIYTDDSGNGRPGDVVGTLSQTNTKTTGTGWKVVTGLNIPINAETIYWISAQLDNTSADTRIDLKSTNGDGARFKTSQTTLTDPWGSDFGAGTSAMYSIYAVVETAAAGTNLQINISDVWKAVPAVQINIGDAWKPVVGMQLNIGDAWKSIF